jgi:hypothetical protein
MIIGSVNTIDTLLTSFAVPGDAYLVTAVNQVWLYTGSRSQNTATIGWVYSGVDYLPPDFTITNTDEQRLVLNTSTIGIQPDIQVTIVKKDFSILNSWNNTVTNTSTLSLLDSDTGVALFLKEEPTDLPNSYYYGGDLMLTDEAGDPIVDENNKFIIGYY